MPDERLLERIVNELADAFKVSPRLISTMVDLERDKLHLERRYGIVRELRDALDDELGVAGKRAER